LSTVKQQALNEEKEEDLQRAGRVEVIKFIANSSFYLQQQ